MADTAQGQREMKDSTDIKDKPTSIMSLHFEKSVTRITSIPPSHKVTNKMVSVKDVMEWTLVISST